MGDLDSDAWNNESDTEKEVSLEGDSTYRAGVGKSSSGATAAEKKDENVVFVDHIVKMPQVICNLFGNCRELYKGSIDCEQIWKTVKGELIKTKGFVEELKFLVVSNFLKHENAAKCERKVVVRVATMIFGF